MPALKNCHIDSFLRKSLGCSNILAHMFDIRTPERVCPNVTDDPRQNSHAREDAPLTGDTVEHMFDNRGGSG